MPRYKRDLLGDNPQMETSMKLKTSLLTLLVFVAACSNVTATPPATITSTSTPLPLTATIIPTVTATPGPQQPPACTFPLVQTTMEESQPETYTFSEPRVVMTAKYGIDIVEWLPDSQKVITTTMEEHLFNGVRGGLQTIELLNPKTQVTQIYATHRIFGAKDFSTWNQALNAIIFSSPKVLDDKNLIVVKQIKISYGNPDETQLFADNLPIYYTSIKPGGDEIFYLKDNGKRFYQLYSRTILQDSLEPEQLLPFDPEQFGHEEYPVMYDMVWRPNTEQVFFKSPELGQSFLFDMHTEKICALDFGTTTWRSKIWVVAARWSPNGRYLAMIRSAGGIPIDFSELAVLDTATGSVSIMAFSPQVEGRHYVWDMSWAPDNYHLAAIGMVSAYQHCAPNCMESIGRLYLVDFISGKADLIFLSFQFAGGNLGENLMWSPDGTKIVAQCSAENQGRLCYIPVHIGGK